MSAVNEYKCPFCGGAVTFDSGLQKMKCPYCDAEFEIEQMETESDGAMDNTAGFHIQESGCDWEMTSDTQWQDTDEDGVYTFLCKTCGGEIVGDQNLTATSCPDCGNPVVIQGRLTGDLKPDYIIPFQLDKKAAKEALKKHYVGKKLLPKVFRNKNHIDEVKGIYVPFWLFDADVDADIRYKASTTRHWSDKTYRYTEITDYDVDRSGTISFEHVPVDGSTKMYDDLMESLEPFDFSKAVPFKPAYLAGYLADKYDIDADASMGRANARIRRATEEAFKATVSDYGSVTPESSYIHVNNGKVSYVLYPVWLLNTTFKGKKYTFAMNGQTGRFIGDLPMDQGAKNRWLFGLTGVFAAIIYAFCYLIWLI